MMKFILTTAQAKQRQMMVVLFLFLLAAPTQAFVSLISPGTRQQRPLAAASTAVVTGPQGRAASSFEEDLKLTLQIIMDHEARSTTASKEQFLSQMAMMDDEPSHKQQQQEPVDVGVPYDAAAKLAFESSDKSMDYAAFKAKYEADAVAEVIAKRQPPPAKKAEAASAPVGGSDVSIPYDAAAKLAYEASDKKMDYAAFKVMYEADAVAQVMAKQTTKGQTTASTPSSSAPAPVDISVPYDAAAKLAYEASDKKMDYAAFKAKYEADAVAQVISKKKVTA
jgi:hypothetical protein